MSDRARHGRIVDDSKGNCRRLQHDVREVRINVPALLSLAH